MATLTWVGGGNNDANNPQDWSPAQVPAAGDTIAMPDGTMNISGDDLAGNILQVGDDPSATSTVTSNLNLSHHADVSINAPLIPDGTQFITNIDSMGMNTLNLAAPMGGAPESGRNINVNIVSGTLTSNFTIDYAAINIDGNGRLHSDGSTVAGSAAVINADVTGNSSFDVTALPDFFGLVDPGSLEFGGRVGGGVTTTVGHTITSTGGIQQDTVKIDQPDQFHGSVVLQPSAEVDLVGLGNADSYSLQNDRLQFIQDNRVIDTLKLTNQSSADLVVSTNGNDAYVTEQGLSAPPSGSTMLTQATAADFTGGVTSDPVQAISAAADHFAHSASAAVADFAARLHVILGHS